MNEYTFGIQTPEKHMVHIYPLDLLSQPLNDLGDYVTILNRGTRLMRSIPPEDRPHIAQGLLKL